MSLEFADFAHYYANSNMTEGQQRENFEVYASILESLVQLYWDEEPGQKHAGISLNLGTFLPDDGIESDNSLKSKFNCSACPMVARKKES